MPGNLAICDPSSGTTSDWYNEGSVPMRTSPTGELARAETSSASSSRPCRMAWARGISRLPSSDRLTPRPVRRNSRPPHSCSSFASLRLTAGCGAPSAAAACVRLPS